MAAILYKLCPYIANSEAIRERVGGVEDVVGEAGDPCLAAEGGDDGFVGADLCFCYEATGEQGAEDAFVDEIFV